MAESHPGEHVLRVWFCRPRRRSVDRFSDRRTRGRGRSRVRAYLRRLVRRSSDRLPIRSGRPVKARVSERSVWCPLTVASVPDTEKKPIKRGLRGSRDARKRTGTPSYASKCSPLSTSAGLSRLARPRGERSASERTVRAGPERRAVRAIRGGSPDRSWGLAPLTPPDLQNEGRSHPPGSGHRSKRPSEFALQGRSGLDSERSSVRERS